MVTINDWLKSFKNLPKVAVHQCGNVEGLCKRATGGRFLFAKVGLEFQPCSELIFDVSLNSTDERILKDEEWFKYVCLGVLDVMLVRPLKPINYFKCIINKIEYHDIDSSPLAFRLAARDAAEKFLDTVKFK